MAEAIPETLSEVSSRIRLVKANQANARIAVPMPDIRKTIAKRSLPIRERNKLSPAERISVYDAASSIAYNISRLAACLSGRGMLRSDHQFSIIYIKYDSPLRTNSSRPINLPPSLMLVPANNRSVTQLNRNGMSFLISLD